MSNEDQIEQAIAMVMEEMDSKVIDGVPFISISDLAGVLAGGIVTANVPNPDESTDYNRGLFDGRINSLAMFYILIEALKRAHADDMALPVDELTREAEEFLRGQG